MSPFINALIGLLSAFAGAACICLLVVADHSRNEPDTFAKAVYAAKWLGVVCILGFAALCV